MLDAPYSARERAAAVCKAHLKIRIPFEDTTKYHGADGHSSLAGLMKTALIRRYAEKVRGSKGERGSYHTNEPVDVCSVRKNVEKDDTH